LSGHFPDLLINQTTETLFYGRWRMLRRW